MFAYGNTVLKEHPSLENLPATTGRLIKTVTKKLFSLRWRILIAFVFLVSISVGILAFWVHQSALEKEIGAVKEKHLIVAQNLSSGLSRYVQDVVQTYDLTLGNIDQWQTDTGFSKALAGVDIRYLAVVDENLKVESFIEASGEGNFALPASDQLTHLRSLAVPEKGSTVFSGILPFDGSPHFFIVKALDRERFAFAPLAPSYISQTQKSISFGERGHSMIVDHRGRVVAHPNASWQATSKDASRLSVVQLMMAGRTGVAEFFSPPMKADMIAGYTFVPETGWGVMVPQPKQELIDKVSSITNQAYAISALSISLALALGSWISAHLTHSINTITNAAQKLARGETQVRVPTLPFSTPPELQTLGDTFNTMVDDLEKKNADLALALDQSEAGNKAKDDFLAMMSHEIRTPLNGVVGILDLLSDSKLDQEQTQFVNVATTSAEALQQLLNDFLDFAKLSNESLKLEATPVDPMDLAGETTDLFEFEAKSKGIDLILEFTTDLPNVIEADPKRLRQVLFNLVGNAVKFTEKGEVVLSLDIEKRKHATSALVISVKDTGIGIPFEKQSRVFTEFFQSDSSHSRQFGGTGLGLAITKRLVSLMGGSIVFNSTPGKGSAFSVSLPLVQSEYGMALKPSLDIKETG